MSAGRATAIERLMARVTVSPGPLDTPCWITDYATVRGYPRIAVGPKHTRTHRLAYEHFVGPIPTGLVLDHLCRTPTCCNPAHLEPVTSQMNTLRGVGLNARAALLDICYRGHSLDDAYIGKRGRSCRTCRLERMPAEYERARQRKAAA